LQAVITTEGIRALFLKALTPNTPQNSTTASTEGNSNAASYCDDVGMDDLDVFRHPRVSCVIRGIKIFHGAREGDIRERLPITRDLLLRILARLDTNTQEGQSTMLPSLVFLEWANSPGSPPSGYWVPRILLHGTSLADPSSSPTTTPAYT
jgi:hypothetical protein